VALENQITGLVEAAAEQVKLVRLEPVDRQEHLPLEETAVTVFPQALQARL
jgi:hypothetical protein